MGQKSKERKKIMKLTESILKKIITEVISEESSTNVPQEAKEKLFARMKRHHQVPTGGTIEDAEFWEVKEGDYGFRDPRTGKINAIKVDGKYYYGEI
jgi:hypothetical protein